LKPSADLEIGLKATRIVTPPVEPTDLELIRNIAAAGGRKYTAGNLTAENVNASWQ
jgi:hypothetical protein